MHMYTEKQTATGIEKALIQPQTLNPKTNNSFVKSLMHPKKKKDSDLELGPGFKNLQQQPPDSKIQLDQLERGGAARP